MWRWSLMRKGVVPDARRRWKGIGHTGAGDVGVAGAERALLPKGDSLGYGRCIAGEGWGALSCPARLAWVSAGAALGSGLGRNGGHRWGGRAAEATQT
jgi:hypothetical protein